jgi:predicted nucleotidyltransferase component of viral defense system
MKLHQDRTLFDQAVRATAQQKRLPEIYIEKDYWVTLALHAIFNSPIGNETVFKGGTSLSKCFGLIDRFSEDIDLVVLRKENETNNQLTNKIKTISQVVSEVLPEIEIEGITHKRGMNRKTAHSYEKSFQGNYGQIRDVIIVEATWLGSHEPFSEQIISSYIFEMMVKTNQQKLAEEYDMQPFAVSVLDVKRTLCEKIMSLIRFSYTVQPIADIRGKIRHTYDIHQLLQEPAIAYFFESDNFDEMLHRVATEDKVSFKNNNQWLKQHPVDSLFFSDLENTWDQIKSTYTGDFSFLVYGQLPNEIEVFQSLRRVKNRIEKVNWSF